MFDLGQVSRQDERIQDSSANAVGALLAYPALLTTLGELARASPAHGLQPYA
ncbi:hypothetical protein [Herbaspirillum sp. C9C3]|uniref:hypothetical protein n=1 Tax=Herbaspirillum sp. C9C3 TaxID=2735271 RepID=UPI0015857ED7|nr:hypothetical protein [Herbaspirillum sp. C9C3]NUT62273.1 hypothetical protein [Herbaspirillum sp. C9C3]